MRKLLFYLSLPLRPRYWIMNESYSQEWEKLLGAAIETKGVKIHDKYTAYAGDLEFWIDNHPYGSFSPYGSDVRTVLGDVRPCRYFIFKYRKNFVLPGLKRKKAEELRTLNLKYVKQ